MARTKGTVGRLPAAAASDFKRRTVQPLKIKEILPQQKNVNIKKSRQVIKTINVRRKSRYFSGRNRLVF